MKKVMFLAVIAIGAFTLSSFTKLSNSSSAKIAGAQTFHINEFVDISGVIINPCNGEAIDYTGSLHYNIHGVLNNNKLKETYHVNTQGVSGTGQTTGTEYQLIEVDNQTQSITQEGCLLTVKFTSIFKVVSAGSDDNFTQTNSYTYTFNFCTNEFTLVKDDFSTECK